LKKAISFVYLICLMQLAVIGQVKEYNDFHQNFVDEMLPLIRKVNAEIEAQRAFVLGVIEKFDLQQAISDEDKVWFMKLVKYYRIKLKGPFDSLVASPECRRKLMLRVDVIPEKIAIAQSAIESGWGQSRFAKEGNNYFGIRCHAPDCGIKPKAAEVKGFYVKSYPSVYEGVKHYAKFLNAGTYYEDFRQRRKQNRNNENTLDPLDIVEGLKMYSATRDIYINKLKAIIKYNFGYL